MTVLTDARPHAVAIKAAIDATLAPKWHAYDYRQVPGADGNAGKLPSIFVLVSLERRQNPLVRSVARTGATGWRLATRSAGTTVDECRWAMERVSAAINEKRLIVAGEPTTRIQFESDEAPAWDDERFTAVAFWTFVH